MNAKKFLIALSAILLLSLSGCVTELSESERFSCIDASSRAYAFVPECETQEKCFAEVQKKLFDFDYSLLPAKTQNNLFYLQNNLAQSWVFFSRARQNIKKINETCSARGDASVLALQVNELNHNLSNAFKFADKANQFAFSALLSEEQNLEEQKIFLIKEEPLFNDFIELQDNLNDIEAQDLSGNSFASFYLSQMFFIKQLAEKTGFERDFISEATPLDFWQQYGSQILEETEAKRVLKIPFFSSVLDSFVSFLNDLWKTKSAADAIQKMPSFEFMLAYNNIAGFENSSMQKFSLLAKNNSFHRKELEERNSFLKKTIEEKFLLAQNKIDSLSARQFASFDQNFFSELYALLGQESRIATQKFSINDFSDFREKAVSELLPLQAGFRELEIRESALETTLGEKAFSLKETNSRLDALIENLLFLESETTTSLDVLCKERIEKISSVLKETGLPDSVLLKASDLKSRIKFKINSFNEEKGMEERLLLCMRISEEFNDFKLAVTDFEEYSLQKESALEQCFAFLEKIFSSKQEKIDLSDFALRYQKIRALEEPYSDIGRVQNFCAVLKNDTLNYLNSNPEAISLKKDFLNAKDLFEKLRLVNSYSEASVSNSLLENFESKFSSLQKYFSGNNLALESALPVFSDLQQNVSSLRESLKAGLDSAIADFASKNALIEAFPEKEPVLGKDFNARVRITLNNPFQATGKITIKMPFNSGSSIIQENAFFSENTIVLDLNSLPLGTSFFELPLKQKVSFEEETIVLSVSETTAMLEKKIRIVSDAEIPSLRIETKLIEAPLLASSIFVSSQGKAPVFSMRENTASFSIENAKNKQLIEIYFSVQKALGSEIIFLESEQIDVNATSEKFFISIKNNLPMQIENASVSFSLPFEAADAKSIGLSDSEGKKLPLKVFSDKIFFNSGKIFPQETKQFFLLALTENSLEFWLGLLEKAKQDASSLQSAEAKSLLAELETLSEFDLQKKSKQNRLVSISSEIAKLRVSGEESQKIIGQFLPLKQKILEEISKLEENALLFEKLGFSGKQTSSAIEKAKAFLQEADFAFSSGDFEKALQRLFSANSAIQQSDFSDAGKKILESKNKQVEDAGLFWKQLGETGGAEAFAGQHDRLLLLDSQIEESVSSADLNKAVFSLGVLETEKTVFVSDAKAFFLEKTALISERIEAFSKALSKGIPSKISALFSLLESVPEETLLGLHYVAPVSRERLQKLELQLNSINSAGLSEKFSSFKGLVSKQKFSEALALAVEFDEELSKKEIEINAIESELDSALETIKEDAMAAANLASAEINNSPFNSEAVELLSKAKSSLEKNQFLKSIAFSNAATGMLSMPSMPLDVPIFILPILVGIALVFFVRHKKKRVNSKKEEFKRILRKQIRD